MSERLPILALDLSGTTGYALLRHDDDTPESGVWLLGRDEENPKKPAPSTTPRGARFAALGGLIDATLSLTGRAVLVIETPHFRGMDATRMSVGLAGVAEECAHVHGAEWMEVHTARLKAYATGNGRAEKDDMIAAAAVRWGREPEDDNEADALCLLAYTWKSLEACGWGVREAQLAMDPTKAKWRKKPKAKKKTAKKKVAKKKAPTKKKAAKKGEQAELFGGAA